AFEVDYSGIRHYEENLLNEIMKEHKPLFDSLMGLVN
ncbi:zinc ribbon domain-containing protein, partial [Clostridium botulinum]|nr:zinc ribbon domain-containing protein [Clostridium botulinum]NFM84787.1 zinc ribbon domain-containing protein [Clostridium botulinum]NFP13450.1 zinc ribbon domain-containing protein [Clostridium botulinum]NFP13456.1 zinc ribbon domain-containing protein [Clostridium botulinum]NFR29767.1 zinc ribbon domain-containing protein [Clostridium botulinum]